MNSGLVSVSFRQLSPRDIIAAARLAGLHAIEWGGDIHVPPGNLQIAEQVGDATREAGLDVACYGSYYRGPSSEADGLTFDRVLQTAVALDAPYIRIWAGTRGSAETSPEERKAVAAQIREITRQAQDAGRQVVLEYHGGTLTDTLESTLQLREEIAEEGIRTLWQPSVHLSTEQNLTALQTILPWLAYLHVFHWTIASDNQVCRHPLANGRESWALYLKEAKAVQAPFALMEFFKDNSPEQMATDARTLQQWLA